MTSLARKSAYRLVIVGAGPSGMISALLLAKRGLSTLLIERRVDRLPWSKAIGITPPSLAILAKVGLDEKFCAKGLRVVEAVVHDDRGVAGNVRFDQLDAPHKFILTLPQSETLEILNDAVASEPLIEKANGIELINIERGDLSTELFLRAVDSDRSESISAEWVLGCDGAQSTVRSLLGLRGRHKHYRRHFAMADFTDLTDWNHEAHLFFTRHGSLESFPLPGGCRRWVALLSGPMEKPEAQAELLRQTAKLSGWNIERHQVSDTFQFQPERLDLSPISIGRVVLAGDAAHIMSPIGGQGMNTGIADADLLAHTVAAILDGGDADLLLERYGAARAVAARAAAARAALGMWVGTRTGRLPSRLRSTVLRRLLLRPPLRDKLPAHFAMLNLPGNIMKGKV